MSIHNIRLLGFVPLAVAGEAVERMRGIAGSEIAVSYLPGLALLSQSEPAGTLFTRGRAGMLEGLLTVQRRLEAACQIGPFLPLDPSAACCSAAALPGLLQRVEQHVLSHLQDALMSHGRQHQWDIILKWVPEVIVARARGHLACVAQSSDPAGLGEAIGSVLREERGRREAALTSVLAPVVTAMSANGPTGGDAELAFTICVPAGGESAVEAALAHLDPAAAQDATLDMRGPLPPISFAAVRIEDVTGAAISQAWSRLNLPAVIERTALHRYWRNQAAAAHPDRGGALPAQGPAMDEYATIRTAYDVLRGILPDIPEAGGPLTLRMVMAQAGPRLVLPAKMVCARAPIKEMV